MSKKSDAMNKVTIYHNPRCSKSREAKNYLDEQGIEYEVIEYLKELPTVDEFNLLLAKLNIKPTELLRKNERLFKEKFRGKNFSDHEWIDIMIEYPKLIERPIVVKGNKAVIGRPLERVIELMAFKR